MCGERERRCLLEDSTRDWERERGRWRPDKGRGSCVAFTFLQNWFGFTQKRGRDEVAAGHRRCVNTQGGMGAAGSRQRVIAGASAHGAEVTANSVAAGHHRCMEAQGGRAGSNQRQCASRGSRWV